MTLLIESHRRKSPCGKQSYVSAHHHFILTSLALLLLIFILSFTVVPTSAAPILSDDVALSLVPTTDFLHNGLFYFLGTGYHLKSPFVDPSTTNKANDPLHVDISPSPTSSSPSSCLSLLQPRNLNPNNPSSVCYFPSRTLTIQFPKSAPSFFVPEQYYMRVSADSGVTDVSDFPVSWDLICVSAGSVVDTIILHAVNRDTRFITGARAQLISGLQTLTGGKSCQGIKLVIRERYGDGISFVSVDSSSTKVLILTQLELFGKVLLKSVPHAYQNSTRKNCYDVCTSRSETAALPLTQKPQCDGGHIMSMCGAVSPECTASYQYTILNNIGCRVDGTTSQPPQCAAAPDSQTTFCCGCRPNVCTYGAEYWDPPCPCSSDRAKTLTSSRVRKLMWARNSEFPCEKELRQTSETCKLSCTASPTFEEASQTMSRTPSGSLSDSKTLPPTETRTSSHTTTPTSSMEPSMSRTRTPSVPFTRTNTFSGTSVTQGTPSASISRSPAPTRTQTNSDTKTISPKESRTQTVSPMPPTRTPTTLSTTMSPSLDVRSSSDTFDLTLTKTGNTKSFFATRSVSRTLTYTDDKPTLTITATSTMFVSSSNTAEASASAETKTMVVSRTIPTRSVFSASGTQEQTWIVTLTRRDTFETSLSYTRSRSFEPFTHTWTKSARAVLTASLETQDGAVESISDAEIRDATLLPRVYLRLTCVGDHFDIPKVTHNLAFWFVYVKGEKFKDTLETFRSVFPSDRMEFDVSFPKNVITHTLRVPIGTIDGFHVSEETVHRIVPPVDVLASKELFITPKPLYVTIAPLPHSGYDGATQPILLLSSIAAWTSSTVLSASPESLMLVQTTVLLGSYGCAELSQRNMAIYNEWVLSPFLLAFRTRIRLSLASMLNFIIFAIFAGCHVALLYTLQYRRHWIPVSILCWLQIPVTARTNEIHRKLRFPNLSIAVGLLLTPGTLALSFHSFFALEDSPGLVFISAIVFIATVVLWSLMLRFFFNRKVLRHRVRYHRYPFLTTRQFLAEAVFFRGAWRPEGTVTRYGVLYASFRSTAMYFLCPTLLFVTVIGLLSSYPTKSVAACERQMLIGVVIQAIYFMYFVMKRPLRSKLLNMLMSFVLISQAASVMSTAARAKSAVTHLTLLQVLLTFFYILFAIALSLYEHFVQRHHVERSFVVRDSNNVVDFSGGAKNNISSDQNGYDHFDDDDDLWGDMTDRDVELLGDLSRQFIVDDGNENDENKNDSNDNNNTNKTVDATTDGNVNNSIDFLDGILKNDASQIRRRSSVGFSFEIDGEHKNDLVDDEDDPYKKVDVDDL